MRVFLLILPLLSVACFAKNPYILVDRKVSYSVKNKKIVENMTAIRDQNGAGNCYGFSATYLIDQYYCSQQYIKPDLRAKCQNGEPIFSSLYVSSLDANNKSIVEGGHSNVILGRLLNNLPLVTEECAPYYRYADFLYQYRIPDSQNPYEKAREAYNKGVSFSGSCTPEFAKGVASVLGNFETGVEQISIMSRSIPFEEFLYKAFVPEKCFDSNMQVFIGKVDFDGKDAYEFKNSGVVKLDLIIDQVRKLINDNKPVIYNYRHENQERPEESGLHAIVISGIKEVCYASARGCVTMFKLQNSWGQDWQSRNDDGWVEAKPLLEAGIHEGVRLLSWLK